MQQVTIRTLGEMKARGEKIAVLTCYDATFTHVVESAGVDVILVGDSLGMVMQGRESTLPVTLEEMVYHTACVARARQRSLLMADMPFLSYASVDRAIDTAAALIQRGGAQMVKLEGGGQQLAAVRALTENGVAVCAHLGLQPQSVHKLGGYRVQGRDQQQAERMLRDAMNLQDAGAQLLVLECVPQLLAAEITRALDIPVIGIGAGRETDAQVLVLQDVLGITPGQPPRFVHDFMKDADSIADAIRAYVKAVKSGAFPSEEHCFS
ncbi:MAG: 3-methyl-2-oxobutanoate hydroxymethyltransferase [Chromatiales bacterium]|jgi:3-methyl-2-oxobutanoate hydroxymethyltransferase